MTPEKVLAAKTTATAAKRFYEWICEQAKDLGQKPERECFLWSPDKAREMGYSKHWMVVWEAGPFEWTMLTAGCSLCGPSVGVYSKPGPFPDGIHGKGWWTEPKNHFTLNFYED